jgi:polyisoprenoid-binding protein YceI
MKKIIVLPFFLLMVILKLNAQDTYLTKTGFISFFSHAKIEDIKAENKEVTSVINIKTGEMAFVVLMKSFYFKNELMHEHFNENYLETTKFPKAKFKGTIAEISTIDLTKAGFYNVTVEGDLEIHGITRHITQKGTLEVNGETITGKSVFSIAIKDFGITVETALKDNIAEIIEITVEMPYQIKK